jgi:hypothetical protein
MVLSGRASNGGYFACPRKGLVPEKTRKARRPLSSSIEECARLANLLLMTDMVLSITLLQCCGQRDKVLSLKAYFAVLIPDTSYESLGSRERVVLRITSAAAMSTMIAKYIGCPRFASASRDSVCRHTPDPRSRSWDSVKLPRENPRSARPSKRTSLGDKSRLVRV